MYNGNIESLLSSSFLSAMLEESDDINNLSVKILTQKLNESIDQIERLSLLLLLTDLVDKEKINEYQQQIEQIMSGIYKKNKDLFRELVGQIYSCVTVRNIFHNMRQSEELCNYFSDCTLKFTEIEEYKKYIQNKTSLEEKLNKLKEELRSINISLGELQAQFDPTDKPILEISLQRISVTKDLDEQIQETQSLLEISSCQLLQKRSEFEDTNRLIEQKLQERKVELEKIKSNAEKQLKPYIEEAKANQIRGGLFAIISDKPLKIGLIEAYRNYTTPEQNEAIFKLDREISELKSKCKKLNTELETIQKTKKEEEKQKNDLEKQKADRLLIEKELKKLNDLQRNIEESQKMQSDKEKEILEVKNKIKTLSESFNDRLREIRKVDKEYLKSNVTLVGNKKMPLEEYIRKCEENKQKIKELQR